MMFNKKGISPIGILGEILIVLAVIFILLAIVLVPRLTQSGDIVGVQIRGIGGDADKDGIRNLLDKCPCTFGNSIAEGCPATFTNEQMQEDLKKYNSEPPCGIVESETTTTTQTNQPAAQPQKPAEQKPVEQKSGPAQPKQYQSIELFADDDGGADPADEIIRLACAGWVGGSGGTSCHSEDDDCDGHFNLKTLKEGRCWIMASEDDNEGNDCGQAKVDDGTIISLKENKNLDVDVTNNYQSIPNEPDPKNLFSWRWKSKSEYGSLLCEKGFWNGCKEANEGVTKKINGLDYKCTGSEWVKA